MSYVITNGEIYNDKKEEFLFCNVINHKGKSSENDPKPNGDSWIEVWEKVTEKVRGKCGIKACNKNATCGGHIVITHDPRYEEGATGNLSTSRYADELAGSHSVYIVPLCSDHNNYSDEKDYHLKKDIDLIRLFDFLGGCDYITKEEAKKWRFL